VDLTSGLIEGKRWSLNIIICSWNMVALVMSVWWSCFPQSNTLLFIECSDVAGREHIVHVNLPPDYPEKQPLATAVSPSMCYFPLGWSPIQMLGVLCGSFFSLESDAILTHLYLLQDLPIAVELRWGPDGTMNAILSQFQLVGFTFSFLKYVSLSTVAFALKG